ncbi:MAG: epoxyqueuosine reductase [Desulfobacteraceae bacterium]|nr:epoxyqueuosine reductase [Desulfobacteraceae bacterium]
MKSFEIRDRIINKALEMGADLAGIADVRILKSSPSHEIFEKIGMNQGAVGSRDIDADFKITWPENAHSALVIAVHHPESQPELDWWQGKGTPGNDTLIAINRKIKDWIETSLEMETHPIPYHIEAGGIFLKDTAVLAGLGCIGKNNMLVTPEFGPRVRLRAMLLSSLIDVAGPLAFDPCRTCAEPCRKACPQSAFNQIIYQKRKMGMDRLPGRNGSFDRNSCGKQMALELEAGTPKEKDRAEWSATKEGMNEGSPAIKFCRNCEFACPVGKHDERNNRATGPAKNPIPRKR